MHIYIGLSIDMMLYFVLKWVYGTPVSLTVVEVQIIITLHNNNILPINCCRGNKQLFDIKYIFCALRPLGNFGFCRMKLHIPPSGHGPRLISVRLCGFTSQLEEHGDGIAVFLCYYPNEAFTVCRFFVLLHQLGF